MSPKTVAVRDLSVSYGDVGEGAPLILLHGGLATAEISWERAAPLLSSHFRVLTPDSRGHGRTDNPAGWMSYEQFADDVVAFAEAVGAQHPLVFGFSDGGQVGLELARKHPGFARAYVLGGTLGERTEAYIEGLRRWGFLGPGELDLGRIEAAFGPFFEAIQHIHHGDGMPEYWRRAVDQVSTLWHGMPSYSEEQLSRMGEPTLVVTGDRDDMATPEQALRLYRHLAAAELAIIANADHSAPTTDAFWQVVEDFLLRQVGLRQAQGGW